MSIIRYTQKNLSTTYGLQIRREMNLKSKRGLFKEFMNRKILGES